MITTLAIWNPNPFIQEVIAWLASIVIGLMTLFIVLNLIRLGWAHVHDDRHATTKNVVRAVGFPLVLALVAGWVLKNTAPQGFFDFGGSLGLIMVGLI
jgi:predicted permease